MESHGSELAFGSCPAIECHLFYSKPYGSVRLRASSWQLPLRSEVTSPASDPLESYGSGLAPGSCPCDRRSRLSFQTLWNRTAQGWLMAAAPAIESHVYCFKHNGIVRLRACSWQLPLRSKVTSLASNLIESHGSGLALGSCPCDRRSRLSFQTVWNRTVQGFMWHSFGPQVNQRCRP